MTGKNLRFTVYLANEVCDTEEYHNVALNELLAIIREVNNYGHYRNLDVLVEMNDGEWLQIFGLDQEDLSDEDETCEEMFIKEWVDCDLDDRSSWDPEFVKEIDEHGGFKFYPIKN